MLPQVGENLNPFPHFADGFVDIGDDARNGFGLLDPHASFHVRTVLLPTHNVTFRVGFWGWTLLHSEMNAAGISASTPQPRPERKMALAENIIAPILAALSSRIGHHLDTETHQLGR